MSRAARLTRAHVLEIRRRVAAGESQAAVARAMDLGDSTVSRWIGHDRMPVLDAPTKAEMAARRTKALEIARREPRLTATEIARRCDVSETTVSRWLAQVAELQPWQASSGPAADGLDVDYRAHNVVPDDWRALGLPRWAYLPKPVRHEPRYQSNLADLCA